MARELRNRLINGILDKELQIEFARHFRGRLIDIGCGEKPYAAIARPYVTEHVGVDHLETQHDPSSVDLFGTAYDIPVPDLSFDSALCTSVLEHLEEPEVAIRECYRVLRPGGVAVYSVPFFWQLHEEPRDFYRFTKYGLRYLFEKVGFEIVELRPLSGYWVTSGQMFAYYLDRANRGILRTLRIVDAANLVVQATAGALERLDKPERWTWMYLVVARRPSSDPLLRDEASK